MNRVIKFRAWDSIEKEMIEWEELINWPDAHNIFLDVAPWDRYTPLQFTGFIDNKVKDIYEDDVIYLAGYGNCLVVFPFTDLYDAVYENGVGEIKGNIHENPELLEK